MQQTNNYRPNKYEMTTKKYACPLYTLSAYHWLGLLTLSWRWRDPRLLGFKVGSSTSLLLQTVGVLLNKSNITAIKPLSGETRGRDRTRDSLERGAIKILHNLRLLQQHYFVEKLSMVYFNSVDASWTLLQTRNLINVLFFSFILSPCLPWAVSATVWPTMLPAMRFMLCLPH